MQVFNGNRRRKGPQNISSQIFETQGPLCKCYLGQWTTTKNCSTGALWL